MRPLYTAVNVHTSDEIKGILYEEEDEGLCVDLCVGAATLFNKYTLLTSIAIIGAVVFNFVIIEGNVEIARAYSYNATFGANCPGGATVTLTPTQTNEFSNAITDYECVEFCSRVEDCTWVEQQYSAYAPGNNVQAKCKLMAHCGPVTPVSESGPKFTIVYKRLAQTSDDVRFIKE